MKQLSEDSRGDEDHLGVVDLSWADAEKENELK